MHSGPTSYSMSGKVSVGGEATSRSRSRPDPMFLDRYHVLTQPLSAGQLKNRYFAIAGDDANSGDIVVFLHENWATDGRPFWAFWRTDNDQYIPTGIHPDRP